MVKIYAPSDIKIKLNSIKDSQGQPIDLSTAYLKFIIKDAYGCEYIAVYNGEDSSQNKHTYYADEVLYVLIENYKLRGELQWRIGSKIDDDSFEDGYWNFFGGYSKMNIIIE